MTKFRLKNSYEFPCGVMRIQRRLYQSPLMELRIPMWGYELSSHAQRQLFKAVTNPHVGL
mgnify:CR=1 FL=1